MMENMDPQVVVSILSAAALAAILFRKWIWSAVRLAGRTAVGGAVLAGLSLCSGFTGLQLGVNLVNALVLGVLGLPGFGLLVALNAITG